MAVFNSTEVMLGDVEGCFDVGINEVVEGNDRCGMGSR